MELKEMILEGTLEVFNRKGIKFTMDDIAKALNISKKTIYTVFDDKESLFMAMVDLSSQTENVMLYREMATIRRWPPCEMLQERYWVRWLLLKKRLTWD